MIGNFVWGDGGKAITPDEAKRRREIAMAMIQQGTANRPIQHWAQGAANVAQALMGAYDMRQTDKQEAAAREESKAREAQFLGMLGGSGSTAPASSVAAPSVGGANPNEVSNQFLDAVKANGIQNPVALAAIGATGERESGWSPKRINATWADPSESGQAGTSGGLMSWRAERLDNLRKFAAANGETGLGSPQTQARFFVSESPQLVQRLNTAKTPQEAMLAMNDAWRFAGYNRPGGERDARLSAAEAWAARMGRAPNIASTPEMAGPIGNAPEMPADSAMAQPMPDRPMTASPAAVASPAPVAPNPATQQVAQANPQLLQAAMARMNDPYASPGSRAVAQALLQRIISQETKDPMAQEKLRLEVEDMRKRSGRVEMETMTAPDGTVFEREKSKAGAQWQPTIRLPAKPDEATSDQRELAQINKEREAAGQPKLRLDEWKIQKNRANATTVNIGQDGQQYGNPGDGLVWQRDQTGKVMIDERGAPIAIPYRGGKMFVDDQKRADAKAEQVKQKSAQGNMIVEDIDRAKGIMDTSTLPTTGGFGSVLSRIPGTAAADMSKILDGIKANIGFDKLAEMRAASPTGAALGSVTEKELTFLQSVVGSLEQSQSAAQFRFNLTRLKNAYLDTIHGVGKGPPRDPLPNVPGVKPRSTAPANLQPDAGKVLLYNPQTGEFE
jgi:hypothetical protein